MAIRIHPHARKRMEERSIGEGEVIQTVEEGEMSAARFSRTRFKRNFPFEKTWREKQYRVKQIEVYAVKENEDWVIITVLAKYF